MVVYLQAFLSHHGITQGDLVSLCHLGGPRDCIFAGGSLAEGFGNLRSDIDLYVLCEGEVSAGGPYHLVTDLLEGLRREVHFIRGQRIDIKYLRYAEVIAIWSALQRAAETAMPLQFLPSEVLELCHRLVTGYPLFNHTSFDAFRGGARIRSETLGTYLAFLYAAEARRAQMMAEAAVAGQRWPVAYCAAREAVERACDSMLARRGQTNTRADKWRLAKLAALPDGTTWLAKLAPLEFPDAAPVSLAHVVGDWLALVNEFFDETVPIEDDTHHMLAMPG